MPELDLRFIGTGNAFAPGGLCWNGFILEGKYLFEAPPQALQSINAMRLDANDLDAVVLSHHHGDHFLGLPFLLLQWKAAKRTRPIRIIGPRGTKQLAIDIGQSVYPWLFETEFEVEWEELTDTSQSSFGELTLDAVAVKHDARLSGTLGFHIGLHGRRIGYTGDSARCDAVLDLARSSEVLISECASLDETIPTHMNLRDDIPLVRAAMAPEARLILTHLGPGVTAAGLANTEVAQDYGSYRI
ncbi:MAG: MBL fold metallo-hydrolase [bacterium]